VQALEGNVAGEEDRLLFAVRFADARQRSHADDVRRAPAELFENFLLRNGLLGPLLVVRQRELEEDAKEVVEVERTDADLQWGQLTPDTDDGHIRHRHSQHLNITCQN
jgi:hypothetical protein